MRKLVHMLKEESFLLEVQVNVESVQKYRVIIKIMQFPPQKKIFGPRLIPN